MAHSPSRRFTSRHAVEILEDRIALANDVQTSLVGGILTITTVEQVDEAAIANSDNSQLFEIVGAGVGNITVNSTTSTVDGGASTAYAGVTSVVIKLKNGDDSVILKQVQLAGDVTYDGGEGFNSIRFDAQAGVTQVRNVTVTNGAGEDDIVFTGASTVINGNVNIKTGDGGANVTFGLVNTDDLAIHGAVKIVNGSGSNTLTIFGGDDLSIDGPVSITNGNCNSAVRIGSDNSVVMAKGLTITNGSGVDSFEILGSTKTSVIAGLTIKNGAGNSLASFKGSVSTAINGNLSITNGVGEDTLEVDVPAFTVNGAVKIANGNGNTTTDLTPATSINLNGAFSLTNGAGNDKFTLGSATINTRGISISNGVGDSATSLQSSGTITLAGALVLKNGTGTDSFTVSAPTLNAEALTISNGAGDTETKASGGALSFDSISITNGDGDDDFTLNVTVSTQVTGAVTISNGNGDSDIALLSTGTASFSGKFTVTNKDGEDAMTVGSLGAGTFTFGAMAISNGSGGSVGLWDSDTFTMNGSLTVTNLDGADTLELGFGTLSSFTITGIVKVSNGLGEASFDTGPAVSGSIGGLSVTGSVGNDNVAMNRTTVLGTTTLVLGNGQNNVQVSNGVFAAFTLTTGNGVDRFLAEATNNGTGTLFQGVLNANLGAGEDIIAFGVDANDFVTTLKAVSINGGAGLDIFGGSVFNLHTLAPKFAGFEVVDA